MRKYEIAVMHCIDEKTAVVGRPLDAGCLGVRHYALGTAGTLTEQRNRLDLRAQREAGTNVEAGGRTPGNAREQRVAGDIEAHQHLARRVGRCQLDDGGVDAIQDAAVNLRLQCQADVAGMDAAAQKGADRLAPPRHEDMAAGEFEPSQVVRLVRGDGVPQNNPLNPKYRAFIATWRRLPRGLANALGPSIVRNLG